MNLYIDTSNSEKITIKIDEQEFSTNAKVNKAQALLPFISETLRAQGKSVSDVTDIEINSGPGSYTGIRVGASVANALSWSLGLKKHFNQMNY